MSESLAILNRFGKLSLVVRTHDMGGVDYTPLMGNLSPLAAAVLTNGTGIHYVHGADAEAVEIPEGARAVFLPSLDHDDAWSLAVCVDDTILVEKVVDTSPFERNRVRIAQDTSLPGRSLVDAKRAQAQRLLAKARLLQDEADAVLAQANTLLTAIASMEPAHAH